MPSKEEIAVLKEQMIQNKTDHQEIKSEVAEVKAGIKNITDKLDNVITTKADKEDVRTLDGKFWAVLLLSLSALGAAVLNYIIKK